MLTIEGLAMAGLAPPAAWVPAGSQEATGPTDFASFLAAAGKTAPARPAQASPGRAWGLLARLPKMLPELPAGANARVAGALPSELPGAAPGEQLIELLDGLATHTAEPAPPDGSGRPDRTAEAEPATRGEPSLLASSLALMAGLPAPTGAAVSQSEASAAAASPAAPGPAVPLDASGPTWPGGWREARLERPAAAVAPAGRAGLIEDLREQAAAVDRAPGGLESSEPGLRNAAGGPGLETRSGPAGQPNNAAPAATTAGGNGVQNGVDAAVARPGNAAPTDGSERPGGKPEDRLGPVIRELPPEERSAVAKAWNRAGGRFAGASAASDGGVNGPVPDPTGNIASGGTDPAPSPAPPDAQMPGLETPSAATPGAGAEASITQESAAPAAAAEGAVGQGSVAEGAVTRDAVATRSAGTRAGRGAVAVQRPRERGRPEAGDGQPAAPPTAPPGAAAGNRHPVEAAARSPAAAGPPLDAADPTVLPVRLADSVLAAMRTGDDSIRLVLSPPELGHLDIHVARSGGGLRVDVAAATPEAADMIRQALPALVAGLEARSIRVDHAEVRHAGAGTMPGTDAGGSSRQPGEGSSDGQPRWQRPDWSEAARLGQAVAASLRRTERDPRLLDLVA